jgi:hypothetical protein
VYQKGCDKKTTEKKPQKQSNIECLADVYLCGGGRWVAGVEIERKDEINVSPLIISHRAYRIDK